MCGIVGYVGNLNAIRVGLECLKRLEYRGYDSSGVAYLDKDKKINIIKAEGKIRKLEEKIDEINPCSNTAIFHTRWATHGEPNDINAHPHTDCKKKLALVHNGIIENHKEILNSLRFSHAIKSKTDTEILAHFLEEKLKNDLSSKENILNALKELTQIVKGSYAINVLVEGFDKTIFFAKKDSPLCIGIGNNENFLSSDVTAFLPYTKEVLFLDDFEIGYITDKEIYIYNVKNKKEFLYKDKKITKNTLKKTLTKIPWDVSQAQKGGFKHFMLKEIFEQPKAIEDTILGQKETLDILYEKLNIPKTIVFSACGTSYHASLIGKIFFEKYAKIPCFCEYASELRYSYFPYDKDALFIFISQSGETADTLAALREAKKRGYKTLAITNVLGSTISREADFVLYTYAGPEISVASTKAFSTQVISLFSLGLLFGRKKNILKENIDKYIKLRNKVSEKLREFLENKENLENIKNISKWLASFKNAFYIGRYFNYPLALEGALKLKEIAYIHAEGYAGGEMKHGPIALIDENFPTIALATKDSYIDKLKSNIEEIKARKGKIILVSDDNSLSSLCDFFIKVPFLEDLTCLLTILPLQLLAYYTADFLGHDIDQPRNLAKSVTVE